MNIRATRILAFAALAVASTSYAGDLSPKDAQFVTKAAIAGMSEVEQSKLAVERSANPKIKSYADMPAIAALVTNCASFGERSPA